MIPRVSEIASGGTGRLTVGKVLSLLTRCWRRAVVAYLMLQLRLGLHAGQLLWLSQLSHYFYYFFFVC